MSLQTRVFAIVVIVLLLVIVLLSTLLLQNSIQSERDLPTKIISITDDFPMTQTAIKLDVSELNTEIYLTANSP